MTKIDTKITMEDFEELCKKTSVLKAKKDEHEEIVKGISSELEESKRKILSYMEHFEKDSYKSSGINFIVREDFTVKMPKDLDKKKDLFGYLEERGIFHELISVNHQTLNSFYNAEFEKAKEEGNLDFKVPGIDPPALLKILVLRKS
jgi:hypothetical protein